MKFIFVTGGVVSSLGKGLAAAALGTLLEHRGLSVVLQKFDPYLNVDPGTMNPFQHGEVYVLNDGAETDLDLGHYERFTNCVLTRHNSLTSGQVYEKGHRQGAPGRLPGQDRAGDPARHQRDQGAHPPDRARAARRRAHHRNRRHDGRHRGAAFPGGDPAVHAGGRPAQRHRDPRDAGALHQGGGRVEDQAQPAERRQAARDRLAAAGAHLPQ